MRLQLVPQIAAIAPKAEDTQTLHHQLPLSAKIEAEIYAHESEICLPFYLLA